MAKLGMFEQQVMAAVRRLGSGAYGVTIRHEIIERTGRDVSVGAIYSTLDRLEAKGYVTSRKGEATTERGGRAKRYFEVTDAGQAALQESWRLLRTIGLDDTEFGVTKTAVIAVSTDIAAGHVAIMLAGMPHILLSARDALELADRIREMARLYPESDVKLGEAVPVRVIISEV